MKLYLTPGACSLAAHIALHEAGAAFDHEQVNLKNKKTSGGQDFLTINPKGYVPALTLDSGETVTENIAILDWIAETYGTLGLEGPLARTRLLETLAFISTELHKSFKPMFSNASESEKSQAKDTIGKRLQYLAERLEGDHVVGGRFTVADCYLFVILQWASKFGLDVPPRLEAYHRALMSRPSVATALREEGSTVSA